MSLNYRPIHRAKELIFTSKIITDGEVNKFGLFNYFVQQNEDLNAAFLKSLDLAKEILRNDSLALKISKIVFKDGREFELKKGLKIESLCEDVIHNDNKSNFNIKDINKDQTFK